MLFSYSVKYRNRRAGLILSAAAHAAIFGLVLLVLHSSDTRPIFRQTRCCTAALYWNGATGTSRALPKAAHRRHRKAKPSIIPSPPAVSTPPPTASATTAQVHTGIPSPQQQSTLGTGSGTDNAEPALPVYFPTPGVRNRAWLPPSEQNVVVNVSISAGGEVTDAKLVRGLGNSLDQIVLETVKAWRFRPATLNGTAIASTEELVFPFSQNTPSAEG